MPFAAFAPAPRPVPHRAAWRRRGQLGAVLLAVLAVHAWLIGPLRQPLGRQPAQPPAIQLVTLAPATAPTPAPQATAAEPAPPPPQPAPPPPSPEPPATTPEAPLPDVGPVTPPSTRHLPPDRPVDWSAGPLAPEGVAGTEASAAEPAASTAAAPSPGSVAGAQADDGGGVPPIYATQLPAAPFRLDYRVEQGDDAGIGQLSFELVDDGRQYRARLYGAAGGKPLVDWVSSGGFDTAGVAPQRMVERQRGVDARAVNFQRDQRIVSFSSSTRATALYGGAQDRVSLLLQLMAIARAEPGGLHAGQHLRLQVAGSRGQAAQWVFQVVGDERLEPAGTPIATVHLVREPAQPYDQRVDVWLAREAGHLPVGLRFTQVPSRAPSEAFWLAGPLPAAPAAKP
jgi:Protein of unknown function (DUF3108)